MTSSHSSNQPITLHGVFLDVLDLGVLLTGVSGIGKSELGLGLINRGHRLVADDLTLFSKNDDGAIVGYCPPILQDFIEVRGLGVLNVRAMFGDNAIRREKQLQLIINIINISRDELHNIDRLHGMHRERTLFDIQISEVSIPVAPGRNLSMLVEGAVRNQVLKSNGYNASIDFIQRQRSCIANESKKT